MAAAYISSRTSSSTSSTRHLSLNPSCCHSLSHVHCSSTQSHLSGTPQLLNRECLSQSSMAHLELVRCQTGLRKQR